MRKSDETPIPFGYFQAKILSNARAAAAEVGILDVATFLVETAESFRLEEVKRQLESEVATPSGGVDSSD